MDNIPVYGERDSSKKTYHFMEIMLPHGEHTAFIKSIPLHGEMLLWGQDHIHRSEVRTQLSKKYK